MLSFSPHTLLRCSSTRSRLFSSLSTLSPSVADADQVVYRGVGYSDELLDLYFDNIGEIVYLYNFTSTSRVQSEAIKFAKRHGARAALMTIRIPTEMNKVVGDVSTKSHYQPEQEMLIACNTGYLIESVDLEARMVELTIADISRCLSKTKRLCTVSRGSRQKSAE